MFFVRIFSSEIILLACEIGCNQSIFRIAFTNLAISPNKQKEQETFPALCSHPCPLPAGGGKLLTPEVLRKW
jgi:hypothetical protein